MGGQELGTMIFGAGLLKGLAGGLNQKVMQKSQ